MRRPWKRSDLTSAVAIIPGVALVVGGIPHGMYLGLGIGLLSAAVLVVFSALHLVGAALATESLALLIAGAIVAGFGQGLGFRAGPAEIAVAAPADRRGEITSTFFVVLYVAISIPVIGVGLAANHLGLRPAGIGFAVLVAVISVIALATLLLRRHSRTTSRNDTAV